MEGAAPTRRAAQHERKRKIEDGRGSHATCFAPIKTRMSQKYADAANGKPEKAEGVDPMGDANQGRVPRRIQNICVLDCDPWEVRGLRHCKWGKINTGNYGKQLIMEGR